MKTVKTLGAALGLLGCLNSMPAAQANTQILDQVVAIVDDDVIMASELSERITTLTDNLKARNRDLPPEDVLVRETLDMLILESIQLQMGRRFGVRISDGQLNAAMGRIAAQNGLSLEEFRTRLEAEGKSYARTREEVRREMTVQRVQAGNVNQLIQISEQEVDNFLATEEGQKLIQAEYRLVHALLEISPDADAKDLAAAEAHIAGMMQQIRAGKSFNEVISSSGGKYTFTGGDLGWRKADDLPSLFAEVAPALEIGETADPIRSASGIHLVNLHSKRGGDKMVDQTKVRHILVKPNEIMDDEQARQLAADLKKRCESGEDFAELAKEFSEDMGSAQEGGDLGWTMKGQMVPEFEQAMLSTDIGEISEPVKSQFGWHILEVADRREHDMTEETVRNKAANYLHEQKYQEELDAWLRKIRDEAFVDIK